MKRRQLLSGSAAALAALATPAWAQDKPALQRIRERGSLVVGVYNEMPPFHNAGQGIDVALAGALAKALGVKLTLLPFNAGEDMNDDLRAMVWRGHY
ncbi:MAG: ABC transporter substrate-binding protein, partial [Burkholderiales bacterium PBB5]